MNLASYTHTPPPKFSESASGTEASGFNATGSLLVDLIIVHYSDWGFTQYKTVHLNVSTDVLTAGNLVIFMYVFDIEIFIWLLC